MCKNKFKAEDKKNPALIDDALKNRVSVGMLCFIFLLPHVI